MSVLPGYTITRDGRVQGPSGKWLSTQTNKGFLRINVTINGTPTSAFIHNLVCETYHGPRPTPEHEAEHIDGNRLNNHADNLRWNLRHNTRHTRNTLSTPFTGTRNGNSKLDWDTVRQIRTRYTTGHELQKDLATEYGISSNRMSKILRNIGWHDPDYTPPQR